MKKSNKKMKLNKDKWLITFPAVLLLCAGFYMAYSYVRPAPPDHFSIATGSENGAYTHYARQYAKYIEKQGIRLDIVTTDGSIENLSLLDHEENGEDNDKNNGVDVAFVQSGVADASDHPQLQGVASIYSEPMWIFLKKKSPIKLISELKGKRVGTGLKGSGSYPAAMTILKDNGISTDNTTITTEENAQLAKQLSAGKLDAVMLVAESRSPDIQQMLLNPAMRLLNVLRAEAYDRRHPMFSKVILPRGAISPESDIPKQDINLISPVATLVINQDIHPALVSLLLQAVDSVHDEASLFDSADAFPSAKYLDFPIAQRAERYFKNGPPFLQRYMPFWAANLIDRLIILMLPLITLMIPLSKIVPPLYRWRVRSRIYSWYEQLLKIDHRTDFNMSDSSLQKNLIALDKMEQEVNDIEVPLSYADSKYNLRLHIKLVREKIQLQAQT
jgi:TRAP transporter TAXI family solute receptor